MMIMMMMKPLKNNEYTRKMLAYLERESEVASVLADGDVDGDELSAVGEGSLYLNLLDL